MLRIVFLLRYAAVHHSLRGDFDAFARVFKEVTVAQALLNEQNACQEIDRVLRACWIEKLPVYIRLPTGVEALAAKPSYL